MAGPTTTMMVFQKLLTAILKRDGNNLLHFFALMYISLVIYLAHCHNLQNKKMDC